jgi:surfeit locus 1 family protein
MTILYIFPGITLGLGIWQTYRLQWKLNLINQAQLETVEYKPGLESFANVKAKGRFDYSKEILIGPRPFSQQKQGQRNAGYLVITPFVTKYNRILVNRGWYPFDSQDSIPKPTEEIEIYGMKRESESSLVVTNCPDKNEYKRLDIQEFSAHLNTDPELLEMSLGILLIIVDNNIEMKPLLRRNLQKDWKNNHLEYALTWFGLTIGLVAMIRTKSKRIRFR